MERFSKKFVKDKFKTNFFSPYMAFEINDIVLVYFNMKDQISRET